MKYLAISLCLFLFVTSCNGTSGKQKENKETSYNLKSDDNMNVKDKSFDELYKQIEPSDIREYLSALVVKEDHSVITAGTEQHFNSMVVSWEMLGHYFEEPMTFCLLGASRYTLEFIRKEETYTMSFLPEQFKSDIMAFGTKSGRNSDKMKETKLTYVKTPSGNITYKEATVVVECQLFEVTTVQPDDFYTQKGKEFIENGHKEGNDYQKLVFGKVTNVWIRK